MIDRRRHRRVDVDYCVNLRHPLLGVITASVRNLSVSGLALTLDDDISCFVMMEFDIEVQGDGWEEETPTLPVQVTRVSGRDIAVRFLTENSVSAVEQSNQLNEPEYRQPECKQKVSQKDKQEDCKKDKTAAKDRYEEPEAVEVRNLRLMATGY